MIKTEFEEIRKNYYNSDRKIKRGENMSLRPLPKLKSFSSPFIPRQHLPQGHPSSHALDLISYTLWDFAQPLTPFLVHSLISHFYGF